MKNVNAEISIIVPAHNEEKHIARCLDSILNQTFKNYEVICVDDHSTDTTFDIMQSYAQKHPEIKVVKSHERGLSAARKVGIDNSNGKYIGAVDSDDFIQPQMFEFLYRAVTENSADMALCKFSITDDYAEETTFEYNCRKCICDDFIEYENGDFPNRNSREMIIATVWTKLIKREFLKKYSWFNNYAVGQDSDFSARLWINTDKIYFVDLPLYNYYSNPNSALHSSVKNPKWFDYPKTRFAAYETYKNKYKLTAAFYLHRGIISVVSMKKKDKLYFNSEHRKELNHMFFKYCFKYLFLKYIPLKVRIYYLFSFIFN